MQLCKTPTNLACGYDAPLTVFLQGLGRAGNGKNCASTAIPIHGRISRRIGPLCPPTFSSDCGTDLCTVGAKLGRSGFLGSGSR